MSIEFRNAREVAEGECILAADAECLANAINDRLTENIGDPMFRIAMGSMNGCRQIRLPNGSAWPAMHELLSYYVHLDPDTSAVEWPVAAHGDPEGLSPASPLGAFVMGRDGVGNEYDRTSIVDPFYIDASPAFPTTPSEKWAVGKSNRGGYDDTAGVLDSPSFEAAQDVFRFEFGSGNTILQLDDNGAPPNTIGLSSYDPQANPHGSTAGSYFPEPERVSGEEHCEPGGDLRVNHIIKFTPKAGGAATEFPGTCPPSSTHGASDHVQAVYEGPFEWLVVEFGGTLHRFSKAEWVEGPYTGWGRLSKDRGRQLEDMLSAYLHQFRGSSSQIAANRANPGPRVMHFDQLLTEQYRLAPAYAEWDAVGETLDVIYPDFTTSDDTPVTVLDCDQGGTTWATHSGYVFAAFRVALTNQSGDVCLHIKDGSTLLHEVVVPDGDGELIHFFDDPFSGVTISIEVAAGNTGTFDSVSVEILEQWEYNPQAHDLYLLMRLKATSNDSGAEVDGDGRLEDDNVAWLTQFQAEGWMIAGARNVVDEDTLITNNPVFQAWRRWLSENHKWVRRTEFNKMRYDGTDTTLYFERYLPGLSSEDADIFRHIAPPSTTVTSGNIEADVVYEVRATGGDTVTYNSVVYGDGDTFAGVSGVTTYSVSGSPDVREHEGIRTSARPGGWSNEWVIWLQTMAYSPSSSNTFDIEAYTDHFPFMDRCTLFSGPVAGVSPGPGQYIRRHFNDASFTANNIGLLTPENPTAYRYIDEVNGTTGLGANADEFAKSCQIYPKPYVIKSATSFNDGGTEYVKLVIEGRIQSDDNAPATITDSTVKSDWTGSAFAYRTDENALWEYEQYPGTDCDELIGDVSGNENTNHQDVEGSCIPRFFLTRLIPKPYTGAGPETVKTPLDAGWWQSIYFYLRHICEGFIDSQTTEEHIDCTTNAPTGASEFYDYTWANLLFQVSGDTEIPLVPTDRLSTPNAGRSPLPGTEISAEIFNIFAKAINKLTRARVPIPSNLEVRISDFDGEETGSGYTEEAGDCGDTGRILRYLEDKAPISISASNTPTWADASTQVTALSRQEISDECDGLEFKILRTKAEVEFRWVPTSADLELALRSDLRDLLESDPVFLAEFTETRHVPDIVAATGTIDFSAGGNDYFDQAPFEENVTCRLESAGTISTSIGTSDLALWRDGVGDPLEARINEHKIVMDLVDTAATPIVDIPTVDC